ncbi:MAG: hypothetical protein EXS55_03585 [Candidatus Magasanikbacteria bacterium]|nr:hypothetical protein [Candidatus Magasanikbacteria bacterium]
MSTYAYIGSSPKKTDKDLAREIEEIKEKEIKIEYREEALEKKIEDGERKNRSGEYFFTGGKNGYFSAEKRAVRAWRKKTTDLEKEQQKIKEEQVRLEADAAREEQTRLEQETDRENENVHHKAAA